MQILVTGRSINRSLIGDAYRLSEFDQGGRRAAGFTLFELLVVVFIIGVLVTMFTLSVGLTGGDKRLETEVDRLAAVIDLAREESVIQGREIGLRFFPDGYEFAAYYEDFEDYYDEDSPDQSEWAILDKGTLLGPRVLPEGLVFELAIDGRDVVLKREEKSLAKADPDDDSDLAEAEKNKYRPQIMIFSSGDMSPFTVQVRREFETGGQQLEFDVDGSIEITADSP